MEKPNSAIYLPKLKSLVYKSMGDTTWNCPNLEILKFDEAGSRYKCSFESSLDKLEQFSFYDCKVGYKEAFQILNNAPNLKKLVAPQMPDTVNLPLLQELETSYRKKIDWNKFQSLKILNLSKYNLIKFTILIFVSVTLDGMEIALPNLQKCTISAYSPIQFIFNTPSLLELDLSEVIEVKEILCNSKCALELFILSKISLFLILI